MRVWLIQPSEQLPIVAGARKLRTRLLAEELAQRGHEVVWWASCFNHLQKQWYFNSPTTLEFLPNCRIHALRGIGYRTNASIRRWIDHRILARSFRLRAQLEPSPDVIVASLPPYDLAWEAVKHAKHCGARAIVDIRDKWPDNFVGVVPQRLRALARLALAREYSIRNRALAHADAIVAVTEPYLEWGLHAAGRPRGTWDEVIYLGSYRESEITADTRVTSLMRDTLAGRFVVAFVGTFSTYHNPADMIQAARLLRNRTDIVFVLMGAGPLDSHLRSLAAGLDNVQFTGWLDSPSIAAVLRYARIGLCTSGNNLDRDFLPNKVFAYLSEGVPIGSVFAGELRDLITTYGFGFGYSTPESLAQHIERLCDNPAEQARMSAASHAFFKGRCDAHKVYGSYADLIERLCTGVGSAAKTRKAMAP